MTTNINMKLLIKAAAKTHLQNQHTTKL